MYLPELAEGLTAVERCSTSAGRGVRGLVAVLIFYAIGGPSVINCTLPHLPSLSLIIHNKFQLLFLFRRGVPLKGHQFAHIGAKTLGHDVDRPYLQPKNRL